MSDGFIVGTYRAPGQYTMGRLTVAPGEVVLYRWPFERRLTVHRTGPVLAVHARFGLPLLREGLVLTGDRGWYGINTWTSTLRRIRTALEEAGFEVLDHYTRFARFSPSPYEYPRERPRPRQSDIR